MTVGVLTAGGVLAGAGLLAAPAGAAPAPAASSSPAATSVAAQWAGFDAWLRAQAASGAFAGTALVARNGRVLLDSGYGLADRSTGAADTAQTKYCIASIGKLFTAVAVAQLVEQHRLSFSDTIGKYLSGFAPSVGSKVTVAELLSMTSGFGDVVLSQPSPPTSLAGMMKLIEAEPLLETPGGAFLYGNDGYIVLGALIEAVTGEGYERYVTSHVLARAGMSHTSLELYTPDAVPGMAHGYALTGDPAAWQDISAMPQIANPSGGAYSTVGDLLAFARALTSYRLLSPQMTATVLKPRVDSPQPGGPTVDMYTYGFSYGVINGVEFVGHNGGTPGYSGQIDIYPRTGYVVVVLTNQDQAMVPAVQKSEQIITG